MRVIVAVAAAVLAASAAAQAPPPVPPDAIAIVRDQAVPRVHYDVLLEQGRRIYARSNLPFPAEGTPERAVLHRAIVEVLVQRAMFAVRAGELGIAVSDAEVETRITQIRQQGFDGSQRKLEEELGHQGLTMDDFRRDTRAQLVQERIFGGVTAGLTVSDDEIAAYYRSHRRDYSIPDRRTVRHILVPSRALIDRLYAQLKAGADFATLARRHSRDIGSKSSGGRFTVDRGTTPQPFDRTLSRFRHAACRSRSGPASVGTSCNRSRRCGPGGFSRWPRCAAASGRRSCGHAASRL